MGLDSIRQRVAFRVERIPGKNSMTRGSAFMRANGSRSVSLQVRSLRRSVSRTITVNMLASALNDGMDSGRLGGVPAAPAARNAARRITGAAMLEDAGPEHLAFAGGAKYFESAARSAAGCIIALPEFANAPGQTIIESTQPRAHFALALIAFCIRRASSVRVSILRRVSIRVPG